MSSRSPTSKAQVLLAGLEGRRPSEKWGEFSSERTQIMPSDRGQLQGIWTGWCRGRKIVDSVFRKVIQPRLMQSLFKSSYTYSILHIYIVKMVRHDVSILCILQRNWDVDNCGGPHPACDFHTWNVLSLISSYLIYLIWKVHEDSERLNASVSFVVFDTFACYWQNFIHRFSISCRLCVYRDSGVSQGF